MVIKYITSSADGTGDYLCDATQADEDINQALTWAANNPGTQLHLKGPFNFDIQSKLSIGSDTILEGDSTAVLRLNNSCMWATGIPVIGQFPNLVTKNIEMYGFKIDCNEWNLTHASVGNPVRTYGKGYYNAIHIQGQKAKHATNINIHNMEICNSMGDGVRFGYCTDIQIKNNILYNLGHCSTFCVECTDIEVFSNDIQAITCSGTRFDNCTDWKVYNNNIRDYTGVTRATKGGAHGIQFGNQPIKYGHTVETNNGEVYNNIINVGGCGLQIEDYMKTAGLSPQKVYIHNNQITGGNTNWTAYFAGITIYSWGNGLTISKNTIDGSARAGILGYSSITKGVTVAVSDNNIINTVKVSDGGYGIWNRANSTMTIIAKGNYLAGNASGKYKNVNPVSESSTIIPDAIPGEVPAEPDEPVDPVDPDPVDPDEPDDPDDPVDPDEPDDPYDPVDPVEPDNPDVGVQGIVMPSGEHYVFQKLSIPEQGNKILLFPMPGGDYALLKLVDRVSTGKKVTIVPDGRGNYYAVE